MASRSFNTALRSPLMRQFVAPVTARRTFIAASAGIRAGGYGALNTSACRTIQQIRGVKTIDFAGHKEKVFGAILCSGDG